MSTSILIKVLVSIIFSLILVWWASLSMIKKKNILFFSPFFFVGITFSFYASSVFSGISEGLTTLSLTKEIVANIGISILLSISVLSVALIGILTSEFFNKKSFMGLKLLLVIFGAFIVHLVFDAFSIFNPTSLILKIDIIADLIVILILLAAFYLSWNKLDKFWRRASAFFILPGLVVDILAEFYLEILLLELIHLILMFGIFISLYFLIITSLIDSSGTFPSGRMKDKYKR